MSRSNYLLVNTDISLSLLSDVHLLTSGMENIAAFHEGFDRIKDISRHLVLPTITLSLFYLALYTRMMRASMLEQYGLDYVVTATKIYEF